jgi:hypothetical protein
MNFDTVKIECVVNEEGRNKNIASAMDRGLPLCTQLPWHDRKIAICGTAPSLSRHLQELRDFDGEILAANGAHDYLIKNGIKPDYWLCVDPDKELANYARKPIKGVRYYVGSCCDPAVFDALEGYNVTAVHVHEPGGPEPSIKGGTGVMTRAPFLALKLGYKHVVIYGADASFEEDKHVFGDDIAAGQMRAGRERVNIRVGDKTFLTEQHFALQCAEFGAMAELFAEKGLKIEFRCGGLLQHYIEQPIITLEELNGQYS